VKRLILILITVTFLPVLQAQEKEFLSPWQEGYMDIHIISTGKGEANYFIFPDGNTMLIDCGDSGYKWKQRVLPDDSKSAAEWVADYINHFGKNVPRPGRLDYFLLSHFHHDHMGQKATMLEGKKYGLCGITNLTEFVKIGKWVDRGYPRYDYPSEKHCYSVTGGFLTEYKACIEHQKKKNKTKVEGFIVGSNEQFVLKNTLEKYDFEVRNLAANGTIWTGVGLETKDYTGGAQNISDENVFSCAIKINYGNFSYYTGGDLLGGRYGLSKKPQTINWDYETPVSEVCGPVTAMRVNHHSAANATNPRILRNLRPKTIFISSARFTQPNYTTLFRILDPMIWKGEREIFCNLDAAKDEVPEEFYKYIKAIGHLVLRVYEGGNCYQVFVLDNKDATYPMIYKSELKDSQPQ
jgi:beta-lactamase superfamily II metal-dependent hydrolase